MQQEIYLIVKDETIKSLNKYLEETKTALIESKSSSIEFLPQKMEALIHQNNPFISLLGKLLENSKESKVEINHLLEESNSGHERSRTILQKEHAVNGTLFELRYNIKELSQTLPGLYQKNCQHTKGMSMGHLNTAGACLLIYFAVYFIKLSHFERFKK